MKQESLAWFPLKGLAGPRVNHSHLLQRALLSHFLFSCILQGCISLGFELKVIHTVIPETSSVRSGTG